MPETAKGPEPLCKSLTTARDALMCCCVEETEGSKVAQFEEGQLNKFRLYPLAIGTQPKLRGEVPFKEFQGDKRAVCSPGQHTGADLLLGAQGSQS